ncbi:50S ribosomal protein L29 [Coxiella endosymbiont of Amblyomma nuttalli]|uniref:50S ribosomal protein L29 n=1 Tax=Coxiella endosymbiont of Amblyomma nuttalli TaxID=2749996 RepID=UPI001BAC6D58|nr:50S ribosomal protein L29 [Coxiella endosymbiont of Amblyomma nuttalli]QTS83799.1 50S ribosomal protein L29 [Coxiella endosymbiont of Amblyomma nuttalli]
MNINNLRNQSVHELREELFSLIKEQFNFRMQKRMREMSQPHLYKQIRRNIACIKTLLKEKELKHEQR